MQLRDFLVWAAMPGAGAAAQIVIGNIPALARLREDYKTYVRFALSAAFAILAWLGQIAMLYVQRPDTWRMWVEKGFEVASYSFGLSVLIGAATYSTKVVVQAVQARRCIQSVHG